MTDTITTIGSSDKKKKKKLNQKQRVANVVDKGGNSEWERCGLLRCLNIVDTLLLAT